MTKLHNHFLSHSPTSAVHHMPPEWQVPGKRDRMHCLVLLQCPQCPEGCWVHSDGVYLTPKMREESHFFPTSTCLVHSNLILSKDFGLWELNPKAQSEAQTYMVSLQSVKLFLWLTMHMLMKCYGIGLQNCKYDEWDANSSHWFIFPRHGKPLLITITVPRLGGEEFLNLSFFLH